MPVPAPTRSGPRVRLVRPRPSDRDEVLALNRASRRLHGRWASPAVTPAQFTRLLARNRADDFVSLLIRRHADDAVVGAVQLGQIVRGPFRSAYLGYEIGAPYARLGYMTEALGLLLAHAFGPVGLHRVEANIQPGNVASLALIRGLGFAREGYSPRYLKVGGRWRDHERWALVREDWRVTKRRAAVGRRGTR